MLSTCSQIVSQTQGTDGPELRRDLAIASSTMFGSCFCEVVRRTFLVSVSPPAPINAFKSSSTTTELFEDVANSFNRYNVHDVIIGRGPGIIATFSVMHGVQVLAPH